MFDKIFSKRHRVLLKELVKTDFKLRYQGSALGIAWSVLKPLMLFTVMYMVFVKFLKFTDGTSTYPIVLLLGISLWGFFTEATSVGMQSIVARGDLLRKINFPKYIIVIASTMSALISLTINMFVVIVFALITRVDFTWWAVLTPLSIIQLYLLAVGVALILSTLYVKYRDISHIWEVVLQALFYAMPIVYPISMVMANFPAVAKVMMLNPVTQSIQDVRHNLIAPETVSTAWNTLNHAWYGLIPIAISITVFIFGVVIFNKHSKKFAEDL
ncbi:ABC transporter permease [Candidatus Saccharibacteria bacterium]|nr:ABC transporter permease [Candidatus Saccharibacteria bacterium]MCL1962907.1 ABC transporter permease [Candidatus Saccharibacteria bacterium]